MKLKKWLYFQLININDTILLNINFIFNEKL